MNKGKFAIGAAIGAIAGIIAGVLTAPKSGKDTRADIKSKAVELKNEAVKKGETAKRKSTKIASEVKAKVAETKNGSHSKK